MSKAPNIYRRVFGRILLLALGFALGVGACVGGGRMRSERQTIVAEQPRESEPVTGRFAHEANGANDGGNNQQIRQGILGVQGVWQNTKRLRAIAKLAAGIPLEQIPEALTEARLLQDDGERGRFLMALIIRLGKANPLSAMACADSLDGKIVDVDGDPCPREAYKLAVLENWANKDLEAAISWVCSQPGGGFKSSALEKILPALTLQNPQRALALLRDNVSPTEDRTYALTLKQWALVDPVRAIEQLNQMGPWFHDRNDIIESILSAWSATDPDIALRYANALPVGDFRNRALESCVLTRAESDPFAALNLAQSFPDGSWRNELVIRLFSCWSVNDPEAAFAACSQLPSGSLKEESLQQIMRAKVSVNPAAAADYVRNLPPGSYRQELVAGLSREWASRDLGAALALAQSLPSGQERLAALESAISSWAYSDPQSALQYAQQNPALPKDVFWSIADKWAGKDFQAALQWGESLEPGAVKDEVLIALIERSSWNDPQTAARLCAALASQQLPGENITTIADSMSRYSISDTVTWACGLKDEASRGAAIDQISKQWAASDPKGLAAYALNMPEGESRQGYLQAACTELAARDFQDAISIISQLPESELRQQLMGTVGEQSASRNLDESARAIASMSSGPDQQAAIEGLVLTWSNTDPQAAADWLRSFPADNPQSEQLQSVIKKWAAAEPADAGRWLTSLSSGIAEDVVTAFFDGAAQEHPEYAAQWTASLPDETQRRTCQIEVAQRWMKTDPAAAEKWISSLKLADKATEDVNNNSH